MHTSTADVNKPGIYGGSVRVWATAWDVFRRAPSGVGRGGRAAVDFVMCFGLGRFLMRQGRRSEATEAVSAYRQKTLFIPGCVQGAIIRAKRVSNCYMRQKEN